MRDMLAGYSADVEVLLSVKDKTLRVPTNAIQDQERVFVYDPDSGMLHARTIKTGLANWRYTEILAGLAAGEQVVTSIDRKGVEDGALAKPETK